MHGVVDRDGREAISALLVIDALLALKRGITQSDHALVLLRQLLFVLLHNNGSFRKIAINDKVKADLNLLAAAEEIGLLAGLAF